MIIRQCQRQQYRQQRQRDGARAPGKFFVPFFLYSFNTRSSRGSAATPRRYGPLAYDYGRYDSLPPKEGF